MGNGLDFVYMPFEDGRKLIYAGSHGESMARHGESLGHQAAIAEIRRSPTSHQAVLDRLTADAVGTQFNTLNDVNDNPINPVNLGGSFGAGFWPDSPSGKAYQIAKQAAQTSQQSPYHDGEGARQAYDNVPIQTPATLEHLRRVQLIPDVLGKPLSMFYLTNFFRETPVPNLIARQPLTGYYEQQGAVPRGGRINESNQIFAEIQYSLEKYPIMINVPIEDRISTQISYPDQLKENLQFAREKRHNDEALKEMEKISTEFTMPQLGGLGSNFHSPNSGPKRFNQLNVQWYNLHRSRIDTVAMAPSLFTSWIENTWAFNVTGPWKTRKFAGITTLPGVEDITCIIDPALEASHPNRIFCVDKRNGARYGQGPIVQKAFDDPYIATSGDVMFEFFEYKIVDGSNIVQANDESVYDRKFSFYITVATA